MTGLAWFFVALWLFSNVAVIVAAVLVHRAR